MAVADRYSRLVLWLKVALPLGALSILSVLFYAAETLDPDAAIPYADVDVERILREQGVTNPAFGGVTADGVAISLTADAVRPDAEKKDRLVGTSLEAKLDLPDGGHIDITSPEGIVDGEARQAILDGGARLESSTGYVVEADRIVTSIVDASVIAENGIRATGPAGEISAGRMELARNGAQVPAYQLVFKDGVRLLYQPGN